MTFLQHFGATRNLHVHLHVPALDGVYVPGPTPDAASRFLRSAEPTSDGLREMADRIARRSRALVAKSRGERRSCSSCSGQRPRAASTRWFRR